MSFGGKVLVVGATGLLGGEIARLLLAEGRSVRSTSRGQPVQATGRPLDGLELVGADLKDPASLEAACRGVEVVVSTASSSVSRKEGDSIKTVDEQGQLALVSAAERNDVRLFVFVSFAPSPLDFPLQRAKRAVEDRLRGARMEYTILRPCYFMEAWLGPALGFDPWRGSARILGDGTKPVSWVSMRDVARVAIAASGGAAVNRTLALGGPDAIAPLDAIRIFREAGAPEVALNYLPESHLEAGLGSPNEVEQNFSALMLTVARGLVVDSMADWEILGGRRQTVRDFAKHESISRPQ
jgi:uncharacterized protein YbjT (DUF2867 family)